MLKVGFYGGYTIWSAGDDAPLHFLTTELRRRYQEDSIEFVVFSRHPNTQFDDFYRVTTVRNLEYSSREQSSGRWMRGFNFDDDRSILEQLIHEIESCDLLVLGAGNFITEVSLDVLRGHFAQFVAMTQLGDVFKTPVMLYGLSSNFLKSHVSVRMAEWMLRRASVVTFREPYALKNLKASGVDFTGIDYHLLPDPVLNAPITRKERADEILAAEGIRKTDISGQIIAVSVRDLSWMSSSDDYEKWLAQIVDRWLSKDKKRKALYIPQCTYQIDSLSQDDRVIAERICARSMYGEQCLRIKGRYFSSEVESIYGVADVTLATRLHGSVFSVKTGTPVVGISYEDKVAGFFESLGHKAWCFRLGEEAASISSKLEELSNLKECRADLLCRVDDLKKDGMKYVDLAVALLDKKPILQSTVRK